MTDNDAFYVIYILFFWLIFSLVLFHRRSIISVLDLSPHILKFDYLNSKVKVARRQCLICFRVGLKKEKKRRKKSNF